MERDEQRNVTFLCGNILYLLDKRVLLTNGNMLGLALREN